VQFFVLAAAALATEAACRIVAAIAEGTPEGRRGALGHADQGAVAGLGQEGVEARVRARNAVDVDAARAVGTRGRRIARREPVIGLVGRGVEGFGVELAGVADVRIELAIDLIEVLFLDQIVEGQIAEIAGRGRAGEARGSADAGAVGVNCKADRGSRTACAILDGPGAGLPRTDQPDGLDRSGLQNPVALGIAQLGAMLIAHADQKVGRVADPAIEGAAGIVAVGTRHRAEVGLQFKAAEVLAGDDIGHAGDGVGAIGRSGAVLQHFDTADGGLGQEVGVRPVAGETLAVQQDQGALGAKATDIEGAAAIAALRGGGELVGVPRTGPMIGRDLMTSRTDGEPRFSSSSWPMTAIGIAVVFGVPAISEPVTTTSSTVVDLVASSAARADVDASVARATAAADTPQ